MRMLQHFRSKKDLLSSLQNIKLIIGNGFDLYCGLKTKYSDYFNSLGDFNDLNDAFNEPKNDGLTNSNILLEMLYNERQHYHNLKIERLFNKYNIWVIFFYLHSNIKDRNIEWCDIESTLQKAFLNSPDKAFNKSSLSFWKTVYNSIFKIGNYKFSDFKHNICSLFLSKQLNGKRLTYDEFSVYLLKQLIKFENSFAIYVKQQSSNPNYINNVKSLISEKLCISDTHISIDSFNYSSFNYNEVNINHINGSYENAIFGINTDNVLVDEESEIFSKGSRRLSNDSFDKNVVVYDIFENIIVFGHSLNEQDYGYFFNLFDSVELSEKVFKGKLVFAYAPYNGIDVIDIKTSLNRRIQKLFKEYAKIKNINFNLFEKLNFNSQLILVNIDEI